MTVALSSRRQTTGDKRLVDDDEEDQEGSSITFPRYLIMALNVFFLRLSLRLKYTEKKGAASKSCWCLVRCKRLLSWLANETHTENSCEKRWDWRRMRMTKNVWASGRSHSLHHLFIRSKSLKSPSFNFSLPFYESPDTGIKHVLFTFTLGSLEGRDSQGGCKVTRQVY